jgi:NitT/TauT family transport system permease protein
MMESSALNLGDAAPTRAGLGARFRGSRGFRAAAPPLLAFVVAIVAWEYVPPALGEPAYIFPTPTDIISASHEHGHDFLQAIWVTAATSIGGFLLSACIGVVTAMVMAAAKPVERTLYPYAVILQTTPIIAIAPLVVIWFGTGTKAVLLITFIIGFFPIVANTLVGLHSASATTVDLFHVYRASKWQVMWKLRIPAALPYIFTAFKISCTLAVIGTIVGQYTAGTGGGSGGIGYILIVASNQLQTAYVFAAGIAAALIGIVFYLIVNFLSVRVLSSWHESAMGSLR